MEPERTIFEGFEGVHLVADFNDTPTFTKAMDAGNFQLAYYAWYADYPDAEDFYQLVYSKNVAPGPNSGAFSNAAYDKASDLALPSCRRGQLISCGRGFGVDQGSDRRIAA